MLSRLARDRSGNVLGIAAAVVPPLLVLVGGGVDMGRAYLTQTSLQAACDAGVLAGRRAQAKSGQWTSSEIDKATRMFNFNFLAAGTNSTNTSFTPTNAGNGVVSGTATTTMPTSVMKMFGRDNFTLTANCSAEFQISNIDVMFVLDTTGSMACLPNNTSCGSGTGSKILALREAVRQFYFTMAQAVPAGGTARLRFGFVPYSGTVNIGNLVAAGDIPSTYLTASTPYSTKYANFDTPNWVGDRGPSTVVNRTSTRSSSSSCTSWGNAPAVTTGGPPPANTTTTEYARVSYDRNSDICTRSETTYTTTNYVQNGFRLNPATPFTYRVGNVDTSVLRTGAADPIVTAIAANATVPTSGSYDMEALARVTGATGLTITNTTWAGCVEERDTVNTMFTNNSAPTGAFDHDLASAPTNDATRWHPYVGPLVFDRGQRAQLDTTWDIGSTAEFCVPAAMKFTTVDTSNTAVVPAWLNTYLATLVARGNTYHDIGMLWGARLANPNGIMASNVNEGNLSSISRHIIMLTDGELAPNGDVYNAYGLEYIDNRVAPAGASDTTIYDSHNARFLTACATAKAMGYTIWFIGFGQSLTAQMQACASSGRAYFAGDAAALNETFRHIASQVADLRLKT
ncbi:TadE/TadG family type IV pilus assembly protein [Novosphingobium piscinae]|uniref:Pilus assembly protein n=1 Tax=Novosphingobium piscinae TaxID=1507448 RepID=A0A7X1KPN6_9SPHN|nr:TadE/TadG family type IV pilus assembly protein [Novosphingobium piscinae]MBC2668909.1 pilus assembly protein [Novosphingobium piscinae]